MTRAKTHALWLAALFAVLGALAPQARSQDATNSPSPATDKIVKARFEVIAIMPQALRVRSLVNASEIHTFTYSPELRPQMQKTQSAGNYQYGDKVEVWYRRGVDVALKIKGKPSKPR